MANNKSEQLKEERARGKEAAALLKSKYAEEEKLVKKIAKLEEDLDKDAAKSRANLIFELEEDAHKKRLENYKKEGNVFKGLLEDAFGTANATLETVGAVTSKLTANLDKTIDKYVDSQEKLAAHLSGTGSSLSSVVDTLNNTLSATGIVKQEQVYSNLTKLVSSGITNNVQQRAFLQSLADDMDMIFNASNGTLTQLIRLQNQDLSANRMAIEYSLQKFLNQNYQTSEYIKDAFGAVSDSLKTTQSLMSASNAMKFEAAVQTQLGSMYSAGMDKSTIENLANAINDLGSGNISNLGSGISNLVLMAAARAGMDYGELLNNGLSAKDTTKLLNSLTGYMSELNSNSNNVVRSQLGKLFGVSITDLVAADNMRQTTGGATTDISNLFGDMEGFIPATTKLTNMLSNFMFSWGTNIASNSASLLGYKATELIADTLGSILDGYNVELGFMGNGVSLNLGAVAKSAPLLALLPTLVQTIGGDFLPSISSASKGISGIFNSLGDFVSSPASIMKMSESGVSGSIYMGNANTSDMLKESLFGNKELTSNVVTAEEDQVTLEDNVSYIRDDVGAILDILDTYMEIISDGITGLAVAMAPITTGISYGVKGTLI